MGKKKKTEPKAESSAAGFEESLGELQQIVGRLEDGSLPLEESMLEFEKGIGLLRQCYQVLEHAEQRIEILTGTDHDGNPITAQFDATSTYDAVTQAETEEDSSRGDSLF